MKGNVGRKAGGKTVKRGGKTVKRAAMETSSGKEKEGGRELRGERWRARCRDEFKGSGERERK